MDDNREKSIMETFNRLMGAGDYQGCAAYLAREAKSESDPAVLELIYSSLTNCALSMHDVVLARASIDHIDDSMWPDDVSFFVDALRVRVLREEHRNGEAKQLVECLLRGTEIYREVNRDHLYTTLVIYSQTLAEMGELSAALHNLDKSEMLFPDGDLEDSIAITRAVCLRQLGELEEAKSCLVEVIRRGCEDKVGRAYLSIGNICLIQRKYEEAMKSFDKAGTYIGKSKVTAEDVLRGKSAVYRAIGDRVSAQECLLAIKDEDTVQ
jgi:tetratricopeptide (TPR) repeat protein